MHGDPDHPQKNPHPVKRYEVIATAEAPGTWDSVNGYLPLAVVNVDCVPKAPVTEGRNVPNTGYAFEMTPIDDKTWKGYFYRDFLQDEDYFGLGECHWDAVGVTPIFIVHDSKFGAVTWLDDAMRKGRQTDYFKKSAFLDRSKKQSALGFSSTNPQFTQHPEDFFPITVTIQEVTP